MNDLNLPKIPLSNAADVAALVSFLLDHEPPSGLCILGLRDTGAVKLATGPLPAPDQIGEFAAAMQETFAHFEPVTLLGYGPENDIGPAMSTLIQCLIAAQLPLLDAIRVHSGRCFSYLSTDPAWCPPDGPQ
jgi:hypothetical protein